MMQMRICLVQAAVGMEMTHGSVYRACVRLKMVGSHIQSICQQHVLLLLYQFGTKVANCEREKV